MTKLVWDQSGERIYETGLDRGVLYLSSGFGVPWNGLTSVTENNTSSVQEVHYDGRKSLDIPLIGDFSGSIKAMTYPDEFLEYEGIATVVSGMFLTQQTFKTFGLSYRTLVGNDLEGETFAYKIHVVYGLTAVPQAVNYATLTDSPDSIEFVWNVTSKPQTAPGYRPTAHIVFDSRTLAPSVLTSLENILYGSSTTQPTLPSLLDLISFVVTGTPVGPPDGGGGPLPSGNIIITDNGDGTWTASGPDELFTMIDSTTFQITGTNAVYITADTYQVSTG